MSLLVRSNVKVGSASSQVQTRQMWRHEPYQLKSIRYVDIYAVQRTEFNFRIKENSFTLVGTEMVRFSSAFAILHVHLER